ncbi:transglutaminase family protein [Muricauda sp. SCSIO 64092]|uniref:transglutaminase family protein n=1 Tax=Allomuricauda sp. SCSIO 64092 TaxID=2908842 RepID=UPI001FF3FF07|nr:transglutaminase family protein [Muricauda sp. SCSIO 64092]UOY07220.1 transglutaminase family protein [Muricauda sp. SCSIO 64092]
MEFRIAHETEYRYEGKVFFEPHYFRFRPQDVPYATLKSFRLILSPEPMGTAEQIDVENNTIHFSWYQGNHDRLTIKAISVLSTKEYNPFNFVLWPSLYGRLPFRYSQPLMGYLKPYLEVGQIHKSLQRYVNQILDTVNSDTMSFLSAFTTQIRSDFTVEAREVGKPNSPNNTFDSKKGSCRDLAWMQIQLLRHIGIASRFVSGYYFIRTENPIYELHAWTEVFLPGAGWIGYDPSNGIRTTDSYIPLCSSAHHENTMPVTGSIRGKATSKLFTKLNIHLLKE